MLSRGGTTMWMSPADAEAIGAWGNDWVDAVNRNGVLVCRRSSPTGRPPAPCSSTTRRSGPSTYRRPRPPASATASKLPDPAAGETDAPDRRLCPTVLRVQLSRPHREPARRDHRGPPAVSGGDVLMKVMAQLAMVMNLDKCVGCSLARRDPARTRVPPHRSRVDSYRFGGHSDHVGDVGRSPPDATNSSRAARISSTVTSESCGYCSSWPM
jgi:hypothetical protein